MSMLYQSDPVRGRVWQRLFAQHAPEIEFRIGRENVDLSTVEYLIAWQPSSDLLLALPNLKIVFSLGAGVDHLDLSAVPPHVQVVRMVEPGIVNGMVEYVTMSVLALHRNLPDYLCLQATREWREIDVVPAGSRGVGVMGLGVLGQAVLDRLGTFGYRRYGWSRTLKTIPGVDCYAGQGALSAFLGHCDILVCLLPLTDATRGILDQRLFAALPRGASLINVGRGMHLDQDALLAALDAGWLSHAILDVVDPEPLPHAHPFWGHPRIWLTPHIASMTQPETAALVVLDNLRRYRSGEPLHGALDRDRGY
jgi:glyoxylate/hydroxypyruvate reductase A